VTADATTPVVIGQSIVGADDRLDRRVVVITGASRGVGLALARAFAARGARLGLVARSAERLTQLADGLSAEGADVVTASCDITDGPALETAFDQIAGRFGGVDSVIVNAGISPAAHRAHNLTTQLWDEVLRVNLTGGFTTAKAAYPHLARSGRGRLVFTTSVMAGAPRRGLAAYAASKAGLEGLTRALAADWAGDGIRVNAVSPGFFEIGLGAAFDETPRLHDQVVSRTVLGRFGHATELADAFLFLAGDSCGYLTGQVLHVDGGYGLG
jgi:NAD(P)-dependent dehydrogenase (short-subunit alcohol dehydrogenase family)